MHRRRLNFLGATLHSIKCVLCPGFNVTSFAYLSITSNQAGDLKWLLLVPLTQRQGVVKVRCIRQNCSESIENLVRKTTMKYYHEKLKKGEAF